MMPFDGNVSVMEWSVDDRQCDAALNGRVEKRQTIKSMRVEIMEMEHT
jgi:hypothetical protein